MSTMYETPVAETEEKKAVETLAEQQARELTEKTAAILDNARSALDENTSEALRAEPLVSRVKGTIDKLSVFISSSGIRFSAGGTLYVLDVNSPVVQDGTTGIVVVTLTPQAPVAERQTPQS